jgi:amphi-Trp domain-containing protein
MSRAYDWERTVDRAGVAAVLSGVADGVLAGAVELGDGSVSVDIPEEVDLEVELETEDGETSLDVELEWDSADAAAPGHGEVAGTTATTGEPEGATADEGATDEGTTADEAPAADEAATADEVPTADGTATDGTETGTAAPPVPVGAAAPVESLARFELFEDRAAEWRWRLRHRNGNIIATSGEGYTRKHNARKGLQSVVGNAPGAEVVDDPPE